MLAIEARFFAVAVGLVFSVFTPSSAQATQNRVMGELQFSGATKADRDAGVWIDGQYVGYLKELKGDKKIALLPGNHEILVRQTGHKDFSREIVIEPGQPQRIAVKMEKDSTARYPGANAATLKLDIVPDRAAVFVDDGYAGHAADFGGAVHSMLLTPGTHRVKVELPGFQTFETEINLLPGQKSVVKTELVAGTIEQGGGRSRKIRVSRPNGETL
jgi:hypothetical protein